MFNNPADVIKASHNLCIIIERTHGEVDTMWKVHERDSCMAAYGESKEEAVANLVKYYRDCADIIERSAAKYFV